MYGRDPPPLLPYVKCKTPIIDLEDQLETRDVMLKLLKDNLRKAQDRIKAYANKHRREGEYAEA